MSTVDRWAVIYPPLRELTAETVERPDTPWDDRRGRFLEKLGLADPTQDPVIDILVRHLDELPAAERDRLLRTERVYTMAYQLIEQSQPTDPVTAPFDEAEWEAYLAANGPRWHGTDDGWAAFREWFVYHANAQGLGDPAVALLDYLEGLDVPGRIATLGQYGVLIAPATTTEDDEPADGREGGGTKRKRAVVAESSGKSGKAGGTGGDMGGEDEGGDEPPDKRRKSGRLSARAAQVDLDAPTLTVVTNYEGVATQKLNTRQHIGFHMVATLTRPAGAAPSVDALYDFWQEVRDGYTSEGAPPQPVGAAFFQDGPFQPAYRDPNIVLDLSSIQFDDHPGFSTVSAIDVGDWLNTYDVHFRWQVRRRATGQVWTSPEIHHSVVCPYHAGGDVAVQAVPAGARNWVVDLH